MDLNNKSKRRNFSKKRNITKKNKIIRGGVFKFPNNPRFIQKFIGEFYGLMEVKPRNMALYVYLFNNMDKISDKIDILHKKTNMDMELFVSNISFLILVYKNEKYYQFIKKKFNINIKSFTEMIINTIFYPQIKKGGAGSKEIVLKNPNTEMVDTGSLQISFKSICITSLFTFIYFTGLLYKTNEIFSQKALQNPAVQLGMKGYEFFKECKINKSLYKPKNKAEAMIQYLFETFLQTTSDKTNFNYMLRYVSCLKDPTSNLKNELFKIGYTSKLTRDKVEEYYSQKLLSAPPKSKSKEDKIVPHMGPYGITAKVQVNDPIQHKIPIYKMEIDEVEEPIKETKKTAKQDIIEDEEEEEYDDEEKSLTTINKSLASMQLTTIVQEKKLDKLFQEVHSGIRKHSDAKSLADYFAEMSRIDEATFEELLGEEKTEFLSFKNINDMLSSVKDYKQIISYFSSTDLFNKIALSLSGASVTTILYIEFKKMMRELESDTRIALIKFDKTIGDTIDDSMLMIELMKANWNNFYYLLSSLFAFLSSTSIILYNISKNRSKR